MSTSDVGRGAGSSGGGVTGPPASAACGRSVGGAASGSGAASWSAAARTSDHGTEGPCSGGASSGARGAAYGSGDQTCLGAAAGRSGFLVLERLKAKKPRNSKPFVIMITGNQGARHKMYAESLGVSEYFNKPVKMDKLIAAADKLLTTPAA